MTSSKSSTGTDRLSRPYILAVASHKGGTGRTTAALALAWKWGQAGHSVLLVDADRAAGASLVAAGTSGRCPWKGVELVRSPNGEPPSFGAREIVVVDCPALTDPLSRKVLGWSDGVLLTTLADPLALRTTPVATQAILNCKAHNPRLEMVGQMIPIMVADDPVQPRMMEHLQAAHGDLLLLPAVPWCAEVCEWPLVPGGDLRDCAASLAYQRLALELGENLGLEPADARRPAGVLT